MSGLVISTIRSNHTSVAAAARDHVWEGSCNCGASQSYKDNDHCYAGGIKPRDSESMDHEPSAGTCRLYACLPVVTGFVTLVSLERHGGLLPFAIERH